MSIPSFIKGQLFFTPPITTHDFSGKTVVVTGANTGLGLDSTKHLVRLNANQVIMACRSLERGDKAKREVLRLFPESKTTLEVWQLDMARYESVLQFAGRCSSLERLDAVLENAGVSTQEFSMAEKDESTITINVVSAALLSILLLPKLRESAKRYDISPHISIVSSVVHAGAKTKDLMALPEGKIFESLSDRKTADMSNRYNLSKLLILLIVQELSQRIEKETITCSPRVILNSPAPGWAKTELFRNEYETWPLPQKIIFKAAGRTSEVASRCLVHGITAGVDTQGQWVSDCTVKPASSFARSKHGRELQTRVWTELTTKLREIAPGIDSALVAA